MTRRIGKSGGSILIFFAALLLLATVAVAQKPAPPQKQNAPERIHALPPGGPAPRAADGHPDFSGVWFPNGAGMDLEFAAPDDTFAGTITAESEARRQFDPKVTPEERPSFQPWAAAKIAAMTPAERELGKASVKCAPRGVPGMFLATPYPIQLVQTKGQLVQLMELNNNFRVIHTDGRPHAKDPDPGYYGDEVGHWEGDTLVIDTIALDDSTWNDLNAWFHSDQEHVIERVSRPSMNYLVIQITIEDPKVLTKPWTSAPRRWTLGREDLQEYFCKNNEELQEYNILNEQQKAAQGKPKTNQQRSTQQSP
jgi:hypothetical protein